MADLAVEAARREAITEVERLLQRSDDLKRLPGLLQSYTAKHQAAKTQLTSNVASQVDAVRSGLEILGDAQKTLSTMRNCYAIIDTLCTECASLIENHEKIQVLSAVHYNLGKTLQDVENILALPVEASSAESMLASDVQLMQVEKVVLAESGKLLPQAYEMLSILEGTSSMAQQAMQKGSKLKREDTHNVDFYFNKVKETLVKFEERLWSVIRNFVVLGRENPAMLVNAVRIVELQEMVDAKLDTAVNTAVGPKRYRKRCEQQIAMCIQDLFAPLLQACSRLAAAGENTDKRTREILEQAHDFTIQLADIYDYVTPCFPARYNIFHVIFRQYHEHVAFLVDCVGACADSLANSDIIKVISFMTEYQETLRELGIEEEELHFPAGPNRGSAQLAEKYISRVEATLTAWFTNILKADLKAEPRQDDAGLLWTPGAVDFFRIVNEQMQVIQTASAGSLLLRSGQASLRVMRNFQEAQSGYLEEGLPEAMLCAYINNNLRCYNEAVDFADLMEEALEAAYKGQMDIEAQSRGFLDLAKLATRKLVDSIFREPAFLELFQKLYHSQEWVEGSVTSSILATLADFFGDYHQVLHASYYKRLAEQCLEQMVARFVAAMLTHLKAISDDVILKMQRDIDAICSAFEAHVKLDTVRRLIQALEDLKDLVGSDNVDTFIISYNSLIQVAPGIHPLLVERLIVARPDLLKADVKEVMEQFKEVYSDRQKALGNALPALPKAKTATALFKDSQVLYQLALEAALRKPEPLLQAAASGS